MPPLRYQPKSKRSPLAETEFWHKKIVQTKFAWQLRPQTEFGNEGAERLNLKG